MPVRRALLVGLMIVAGAAACGSSGDANRSGTYLDVDGVATTGGALVRPDTNDPTPPVPDPADAQQIDVSGSVDCNGDQPTGTGVFAVSAAQVCADLPRYQGLFAQLGASDGAVCAEIYGGPQHASISGAINGEPVDVSVERTDSCGIEAWQSLEWLLGPPER